MGHTHDKRRDKRPVKRDVVFADDGQYYACVTKMLGNCRVMVRRPLDGCETLCKIRGNMQKRVYLAIGDWVLVCDRDALAGNTGDVVHKYSQQEAGYLMKIGEIQRIRPDPEREMEDDFGVDFEQDDTFVGDI